MHLANCIYGIISHSTAHVNSGALGLFAEWGYVFHKRVQGYLRLHYRVTRQAKKIRGFMIFQQFQLSRYKWPLHKKCRKPQKLQICWYINCWLIFQNTRRYFWNRNRLHSPSPFHLYIYLGNKINWHPRGKKVSCDMTALILARRSDPCLCRCVVNNF